MTHSLRQARRGVVCPANSAQTQNGHIRDDTRDLSRRISTACNGPICRKNCVPDARACTRVTPGNLHGKEGVDGSSPSEGSAKAPLSGLFLSDRLARGGVCIGYGAVYGAFRFGSTDSRPLRRDPPRQVIPWTAASDRTREEGVEVAIYARPVGVPARRLRFRQVDKQGPPDLPTRQPPFSSRSCSRLARREPPRHPRWRLHV